MHNYAYVSACLWSVGVYIGLSVCAYIRLCLSVWRVCARVCVCVCLFYFTDNTP